MKIGRYDFDLEHGSYIMGILNVTPDSFSDGGKFNDQDNALKQAEKMVSDGASIIDIGGESTRPGYTKISVEEEIDRVAPVIEAIRKNMDVCISLDTYKSQVAAAGIEAGCDMINDIWGLRWDENMAPLLARHDMACCLMHNRREICQDDFPRRYREDIREILAIADQAGIKREKIILDPGVGFAKTYEQNLWVMKELASLKEFHLPLLLGCSRKSVIGMTLDLPVEEREEGTIATTVCGRLRGASIFRVHDVRANYRALKMTDAIL